MIALGTRGGHDGGIGNGGAVVAADSAGHAGGDGDNHELIGHIRAEHVHDDGDQDAEGAPARSGGESEEHGDKEDDGGQHDHETAGSALHKARDILRSAEGVGHGLQRPGEGEDQNGGHHALEALGDGVHALLEAENAGAEVEDDSDDQRHSGAVDKAHGGVGIGKSVHKALALEEAAGVDHADDTADDEQGDRKNEMDDLALLADGGIRLILRAGDGGLTVVLLKALGHFGELHGAVVELAEGERKHHDDGEDGVEVIGNGAHKQIEAVHAVHKAGNGSRPGGDRRDDAHGRGGGVDEVGELCAGDAVLVRQGLHHGADGQAVEVVVDEDKNT